MREMAGGEELQERPMHEEVGGLRGLGGHLGENPGLANIVEGIRMPDKRTPIGNAANCLSYLTSSEA